jgi:hypothetical protein
MTPTKQQVELARLWPYLSRWDRLVVIWEMVKRLVRIWLRSIPQRWAERQLRRMHP